MKRVYLVIIVHKSGNANVAAVYSSQESAEEFVGSIRQNAINAGVVFDFCYVLPQVVLD